MIFTINEEIETSRSIYNHQTKRRVYSTIYAVIKDTHFCDLLVLQYENHIIILYDECRKEKEKKILEMVSVSLMMLIIE